MFFQDCIPRPFQPPLLDRLDRLQLQHDVWYIMGSRRSRLKEDLEESRYVTVVLCVLSSINIRDMFPGVAGFRAWCVAGEKIYVEDNSSGFFWSPLHVRDLLIGVSLFRSSGCTKPSRQPRCIGEWNRDFDRPNGAAWRDEQDVLVLCFSGVRTSFA